MSVSIAYGIVLGMDWPRYLRYVVYACIFLVPFAGLIVADWFFFPFITGKNFAFRILVEVMFGSWVVLALWSPNYRPRKSLALILGGLFVLSLGVSTILAENPLKAFWSNFERMEGWIALIHLAMYVTVLTSMLRTEQLWRRFFTTSIAASVLVGLYGLFQLLGVFTINQGGVRVDGTLGNATYLAVYMLVHAFLSLLGVMRWSEGSRIKQALYGEAFVLQVVMIFYCATRGTILGLVGGLFLAGLIFAFSKGAGTARKVGIGLVIVVVLLVGGFFAVKDTDYVKNHEILSRIASISLADGNTRFTIWTMAYKGFLDRPIFGWGQEGFNYVFNKYFVPSMYSQEPWFDRAHDVVLDWLIAGGALGALLYLSLYVVLLYYLWKPGGTFDITERALLTGLLAGYAFHNIFVFDNLMSYLMFTAVSSYITVRRLPPEPWGTPVPPATLSVAGPIVLVATLGVLYFVNVPGMSSAYDVIAAIKPQSEGLTKNLSYFTSAASRGGLGSQEIAEQFLQFASQVRQSNIGDATFQGKAATEARDAFLKELARTPNDARLQVFIGSFLRQFGDTAGAEEHLGKALQLSPQKQTIMFEVGALAMQEGDFGKALAVFKDAYELAPEYDQARNFYATAAIRSGDMKLADSLLVPRYGTDTPVDMFILQAYLDTKNFPKVIELARARADAQPGNAQWWVELGAAYLQAGDRAHAIANIEKAISIDPSLKDQGEKFIADIKAGKTP